MVEPEQTIHPESDLPRWDLTHIYPSPDAAEIEADKKLLAQKIGTLADRYQGKLDKLNAEELADAVLAYQDTVSLNGKLASYAALLQSVTLGDEKSGQVIQSIYDCLSKQDSQLVFFCLEINSIDQSRIDKMLQTSGRLADYRHWFEVTRLHKPHDLSSELERFAAEYNVAAATALQQIFEVTLEEICYEVEGRQLRQAEVLSIMEMEKDESKRKEAFMALSKGLTSKQGLVTKIYNAIVKDHQTEDVWRKFSRPEDSRHLDNQIEPEVVAALAATVRDNYGRLSHRYYGLKAKWLNKAQLDPWDRNAPLPFSDTRVIPFSEAQQIVTDAFGAFSAILAGEVEDTFRRNLIDVPLVSGKDPGAFAHDTTRGVPCYVLVNYLGQTTDVMTLAHELGHNVHQKLCKKKQPPLLAAMPLTLEETASVFGEMLTFKALLKLETDPERRQAMIAGKVEAMLSTVVRQMAFYTFESRVHEERKHAPLTSDTIAEIWQSTMAESHGPAMREDKAYDPYWSYVSHFFATPFYVYAYAFGDCLVNSLYGLYETEQAAGRGADFTQKYIDLLQAGGSKGHKELLAPFGIDISRPDFWQKGLDVIARFIDDLEELETQKALFPKQDQLIVSNPLIL
jgi:oligoendopeptidase F